MATYHSGVGGSVSFDGTVLNVSNWQVNEQARLAEVTNSASGGYAQFIDTVTEFSWSCEGPWDSELLPDTDVGVVPGSQITALIFTYGNSAKTLTLANSVVEAFNVTVDTVGGSSIRFTASGKGNTAVTRPTT